MNVQVNVEYIRHISREMYSLSRQIGSLSSEIEDVERQLKRQTEFKGFLRALEKIRESISEEKYKLSILAQAADNIGSLYRRTEISIEDSFEPQRLKHGWTNTGNVDLSKLSSRVNTLLYGDEKGWQP